MNRVPTKGVPVSNEDLLLLGFLLVGGAEQYVDIEHVAVRLFQVAPTQFRWRIYNFPSLEAVQRAVGGVHTKYGERLIRAPHRKSTERMLTVEGIDRATEVAGRLLGREFKTAQDVLAHFSSANGSNGLVDPMQDVPAQAKRPVQRTLQVIRRHHLFETWQAQRSLTNAKLWELADLLTCFPDSPESVWMERIESLKSQATLWQADDIGEFIRTVEQKVSDLRKGSQEEELV